MNIFYYLDGVLEPKDNEILIIFDQNLVEKWNLI